MSLEQSRDQRLPIAVFIGTLVGKYRGDTWPGAPATCTGAPDVELEGA